MMKMKNLKIFHLLTAVIGLVSLMMSFTSCTDEFADYNTNKAALMAVGPKEMAGLFSRTQMEGVNWLTTDNYSRMSSTMANHFCGYVACGIQAQEQNVMRTGWQNSGFNGIYSSAYPPIQSILDISKNGFNDAAYGVALIWKVFLMHRMTDLWGPVPYSDAGNAKAIVAYESQKDVYYKMLADLTSAVDILNAALQKTPGLNIFGVGDMIYNGDVSKWIKFGNTMRLRLAMRLSNVDPDKAQAEAEAAVKGSLMETNADDALMAVNRWASGGNGMPRMESFYQDVMSTSMESILKGYNDPRMQEFFSPVSPANITDAFPAELRSNANGYHGMANGFEPAQFVYFKAYSKTGPRFKDGNQLVTPINIINAAETHFLKAEGVWRNWNMGGGTAQQHYEKGIEISIKQWRGASFPAASITEYINGTSLPVAPENFPYNDPPLTNIPVKFSTDKAKQYEQIMTQKWLALYPISFEAFAEYRRTRFPKLYMKKYSANANVNPAIGQIVTRLPFVDNEKATQPEEIARATVLLGGPDLETTPVWWDVNKNGN